MIAADFARLDAGDHRVRCPHCSGNRRRDDALSVTVKPGGGVVFNCFRCGWAGAERTSRAPTFAPTKPSKAERRRGLASTELERWRSATLLPGTLADRYLRARCCYFPPVDGALRFLPEALHWPTRTTHPAMVAMVRDAVTRTPLSLHFTFLAPDGTGKANVEKPKLLLPGHSVERGVVMLWPNEAVTTGLGVAEGIETALSVAHLFRPMWATGDAGHLAKFPVLDGVESLSIFRDNDDAGRAAAMTCAARWLAAGREVARYRSDTGNDFNDAARR